MSGLEWVVEIASWVLIISGVFFLLVGSFGVWRFPDFWARLHAVSVADSAGVLLLLAGMCLQAGPTLIAVKLIFIGVFLFITGPTATHAVANAALVSGLRPTVAEGLTAAEPEPIAPRPERKGPRDRARVAEAYADPDGQDGPGTGGGKV